MRASILAIFFLSSLIFWSCENDIEKIKIITTKDNAPSESAADAILIFSDSAKVKVKVIAPRMDRHTGNANYIELTKGVEIEFYNDQQVTSNLTADYAIHFEEQGKMEAKGNVILINELGEKLNTEHLIWDEKKKKIYSYEFVKITTKDEIIMGEGFESNQSFTKFKIKKIKGTISIEKAGLEDNE